MKVLILGSNGMLGHMVNKYLREMHPTVNVSSFVGRWPKDKDFLSTWKGDYIINCIGAIPQRTDDFDINWQLPIWLDENMDCKIIHPGTDCEMDIDKYGISKRMAADYIRTYSKQTKSLKTSIIGPEYQSSASLLEWFLTCQEPSVKGYSNAIWNGNTTLEWSKQCLKMMNNWEVYDKETVVASNKVSKYELLLFIKAIFDKQIKIESYPEGKDKSLNGSIQTKNIAEQLEELKRYYYDS